MMDIASRVARLDWVHIIADLYKRGRASTGILLSPAECAAFAASYDAENGFRNREVMEEHGGGHGEYRNFAYPMEPNVEALRTSLYRHLVPIANTWDQALGGDGTFPTEHADYLARCHAAGQTQPTPLLVRYGPGDFIPLRQDIDDDRVFPLLVAFMLNAPGHDFAGGEFVITEQLPRMQSRVEVVPLHQGEGVIIPVSHRPAKGGEGIHRVDMRYGVSMVRSGQRLALGVIFHDAG